MIGKFGAAKDQWFSSFLLQVENHSSWHRLFVDPLSRAMYSSDGPDFEFVQQKRREGMVFMRRCGSWRGRNRGRRWLRWRPGWKNMRNTGVLHDHNAKND